MCSDHPSPFGLILSLSKDEAAAPQRTQGWRLDGDPKRNSLRLLPSGPDRVGEGSARRQPPLRISLGGPDSASVEVRRGMMAPRVCGTNAPLRRLSAMPLSTVVNTYAGNPLDRASDRRSDPAWIAAQAEAPQASAICVWNGLILVEPEGSRLARLSVPAATHLAGGEERMLFLGLEGETVVFALDLEGPADPSQGVLERFGRFENLRTLASRLSEPEAGIAATAKAVFEWRRRHRFCSACGQESRVTDAGWKRVCLACGVEHFPRTDPVVIMLPVNGARCLLGRQAVWPKGMYSALAGFVEPGESIEEACARELYEEAALSATSVRYHSSQPWPFPTNLMIGLIAEVADGEARADETELEAVRWFSREDAGALLAGELEGAFAPPPFAIAHQLIKSWTSG